MIQKHADFPQRGKSAPIHPSLFSPSERSRARSVFIGASSPSSPHLCHPIVITDLEILPKCIKEKKDS